MTIQVQIRQAYGRENIYPICEKAKLFAQLVGQKCLTRQDITVIKQLGYTIEIIENKISL